MKIIDFSAHVDDVVAGASYISNAGWVHNAARVIPAILMFPGMAVGTKKPNE